MMKIDQKPHLLLLFPRIMARVIDILVILVISELIHTFYQNPTATFPIAFISYNFAVIFLDGQTIGRFFLSLEIRTKYSGISRQIHLFSRELVFLILCPFILLNLMTFPQRLIHDRICLTHVFKNER